METYWLHRGRFIDGLVREAAPSRELRPDEVRVRVHAVSLNWRDLAIARARVDGPPLVPCSDGAGEVAATGAAVTRWRVGDRVTAAFYPDWIEGTPTEAAVERALGGGGVGMLAQEVVLPEHAWVRVPPALTFAEASTLSCAGVTAWHALFHAATLRPGSSVLVQGTGGVSVWAMQLARAAGLRVIATSSQDAKLDLARGFGAQETVNYRSPGWTDRVLELTGGAGVDLALDVGGRETIAQSIRCTRIGGTVAMIGGLTGFALELAPFALIDRAIRLVGVLVGSREMTQSLADFVAAAQVHPVIDKVFRFEEARAAYEHLAAGQHVGKVVIDLAPSEASDGN